MAALHPRLRRPDLIRRIQALVATALVFPISAGAAGPGPVDFARQVRPILAESCFECHGPDSKGRKGDLRLDTRADVFADRGGYRLVVSGHPEESELIARITSDDPDEVMPPVKSHRKLTKDQVELLRRWVAEGAAWSEHWSFTPPRRPRIPGVTTAGWCRNPVDRFILARLDREGLEPSSEADRATLLRRLSLDLLGLPPSPAEVDRFLSDDRPDADERLVERLLASPRFGERWARPWLDLVRYADSDGYEDDRYRPDAWRYRDWVIDAFNRDMPFDRFTVEQLAGDLLPVASRHDRIAAGFHRMAMFNRSAMGRDNEEEFRVKTAKDRAATTATAWLGLTFGCAECHTHKYDPLPHRDYYRFYAFFNNLLDTQVLAPPLAGEHLRAYRQAVREFEEEQARARSLLKSYEADAVPTRQAAWERSADRGDLPPAIAAAVAIEPKRRTASEARLVGDYFRSIDPEYARLKSAVLDMEMLANNRPPPPSSKALSVAESPRPRRTFVHLRGDFLTPGEEVRPGTPAFLPPLHGRNGDPDRYDLARWLVDPANPLTARVAVNGVWQQLFGRGLVATPENFGLQGEPPTHPELLDWLATEFQSTAWSRKGLIRTIVTSATYRQSSRQRADLAGRDPNNVLLGRQNRYRVEAEVVRDLGLTVSGLLDPEMGGPGVQPPLPASLLDRSEFKSERLMAPSRGAARYRRGIYVNVQRTFAYPMLKEFDTADPSAACPRRERSNTPLQALTLLNDPAFAEFARALGLRLVREGAGECGSRIRHAFRIALGREPDEQEAGILGRVYEEQRALYASDPDATAGALGGESPPAGVSPPEAAAWTAVARTVLNLDEFITRE
jgi:mono/diheme cytochrome c family protein